MSKLSLQCCNRKHQEVRKSGKRGEQQILEIPKSNLYCWKCLVMLFNTKLVTEVILTFALFDTKVDFGNKSATFTSCQYSLSYKT